MKPEEYNIIFIQVGRVNCSLQTTMENHTDTMYHVYNSRPDCSEGGNTMLSTG